MLTHEELLTTVHDLIDTRDQAGLIAFATEIGSSEWADILPTLDEEQIAYLIDALPGEELPDVLAELDPSHAADILMTMPQTEAADILEAMDPDDATDVIDELPDREAQQILIEMQPDEAAEIRELLAFPPDSAGGLMTPSFVAISPDLRADQAIGPLRKISEEVETMYYVYVLDPEEHLLGVLSLYRIVLT